MSRWTATLIAGMVLMFAMFVSGPLSAQTQWWVIKPGVAAGTVEYRTIESKIYGRARTIAVYTPPGYAKTRHTPYETLYFFDASDYLNDIPLPTVLNNLLAEGKLPPAVAVLIDNGENRLGDLANHEQFARFIAEEVVPFVRKNWNVTKDPQRTIIGGYSAGGLASAYIAFKHPELFGNVLSQSGAFWRGNEGESQPYEWLTTQYRMADKKPLRFYMEVGAEETHRALGTGPVFIETNRRLRDTLRAKGYEVDYLEVPGAKHEPVHWRAQLGNALIELGSSWREAATRTSGGTAKQTQTPAGAVKQSYRR